MSEWISAKERKPPRRGNYLAWIISPGNGEAEAYPLEWNGKNWVTGWKVSHWMPLPEPPKQGR